MDKYDRTAGKQYTVLRRLSEFGKSRIEIRCPFCGCEFWAYLWSLCGGGKKCEDKRCGAMHGGWGQAYPVKAKEKTK